LARPFAERTAAACQMNRTHRRRRAGVPRALRPLDAETERKTLLAIRAFLDTEEYRERARRVLGHGVLPPAPR
jgi:hypothetical protein